MPDKETINKARQDKEEGKAASTQAGEFVHAEIEKVKKGKHGVANTKQAIAIGLSEARRAGVDLPAPKKGGAAAKKKAAQERAGVGKPVSKTRSQARTKALQKEGSEAVSTSALAKQGKAAAKGRSAANRSASAKKAAQTKGTAGRKAAAKKAVRTRASKG